MAGIGMYGVFYANATLTNGIVTGYEGGTKMMGKAISANFQPKVAEENPLYCNNGEGENDSSGASGGTMDMVLDRLTQAAAADLFGTTVEEVSVKVGEEAVKGTAIRYKGTEQSAVVGVAYIRMNQEDNKRTHEVVLYRGAIFTAPAETAKTKGKTIEWQTPSIKGTIRGLEGDGTNNWYESVRFPSQDAAFAYIFSVLGQPEAGGAA